MYTVPLTDAIKRALHLRQAVREEPFVCVRVDLWVDGAVGTYALWLPYEAVYL